MKKSINVVLAVLLAGGASLAVAQSATAYSAAKAQEFASEWQTREQESTAMPAGSPPVDRNAKPDDPIPKATTYPEKVAAFRSEFRFLQENSTP
jgi:hypothetical protein